MRKYFTFYGSFYDVICDLNDSDKLIFYTGIVEYGLLNKEPKFSGILATIFKAIKPNIDSGHYSQDNGKLGGRPPKNKTQTTPLNPPLNQEEEEEEEEEELKEENKRSKKSGVFNLDFMPNASKPIFQKWLDYKKDRKESYKSQASLRACYEKLKKLSNNNGKIAEEIINQSMANNWAGLFELKETKTVDASVWVNQDVY